MLLQKIKHIALSSLTILASSAQCEANHSALNNIRVLNDLLQFSKVSDPKIKSVATLTTCFLIHEENAHLVRTSAKSGVMHFLLKKLETGIYSDNHTADGFTCAQLLDGLSRMALNDTNKAILVYDGILPILSRVLIKGNPQEQLLATHLIWSLTFQDDNKYYIHGEQTLMEALRDLSENGEDELKVKVKGMLFQLDLTRDRIHRVLERRTQKDAEYGKITTRLS